MDAWIPALHRRVVSLMDVYCPSPRNRRITVCQRVLGETIGSEPHQIGVGFNGPGRVSAPMTQAACGYIVTAKVMTMATSQHTHCHRISGGTCARLYRRWNLASRADPYGGDVVARLIWRRPSAAAHSPSPHRLFQPLTPPTRLSGRQVSHGRSSRSDLQCRVMAGIYSTVEEYVS
jgi:hypothetical protein